MNASKHCTQWAGLPAWATPGWRPLLFIFPREWWARKRAVWLFSLSFPWWHSQGSGSRLEAQYQHSLGARWKCKCSGPPQTHWINTWGWGPGSHRCWTTPPGDMWAQFQFNPAVLGRGRHGSWKHVLLAESQKGYETMVSSVWDSPPLEQSKTEQAWDIAKNPFLWNLRVTLLQWQDREQTQAFHPTGNALCTRQHPDRFMSDRWCPHHFHQSWNVWESSCGTRQGQS